MVVKVKEGKQVINKSLYMALLHVRNFNLKEK
jgi:hypothetical protein